MPKIPEQFKPSIEKKEITSDEYQRRLDRLKTMGRVIGGDFEMEVKVGEKPEWRYIFKPINRIEVNPDDIKKKGLEYCFGLIAHEGAHRKISRIDFIPKKIWQKRGFSFLMNAIEDPRVNNWVSEKYDGAKEWLEKVYNKDLTCEEKVKKIAKEKVGYIPKYILFGSEIIRYWHTGKFSKDLPKDVKKTLEKTIKYAELAYENIPDPFNSTEEEIVESAKNAYKIVYSAIYPEYKKLIEQDFENEKIRQMIKEMLENGEIELSEENMGSEGEPLPLDELPEDLREKLKKKIKEKLDSMSEEERKKFEERAEKRAEELLDELEEDENKELRGKFSEQLETKSEERKRKRKEGLKEKRREELKKKLEEIEKKLESEKTEYDKAYEEVKPYIDKVANDLINLFCFQRWPKFRKSFPGQKLRLKGAMKYIATKDYRDLFERREKLEKRSFNFLVLVDLSGSMSGKKIEETFKGVVLLVEALNQVDTVFGNCKVAIYGFQDELIEYKKIDEPLDDRIRKKMSIMKKEVNNKGEHNKSGYNNDGYCLDKASKILEKTEGEKFLVVLSDGLPVGDNIHHLPGYDSSTEEEELLNVVKNISENTDQKVLGIGLGPGTGHVKKFYSEEFRNVENMPNVNVKQLSEKIAKKLKELIE